MRNFLKLVVVVVVSGLTWLATSRLVAQQRARNTVRPVAEATKVKITDPAFALRPMSLAEAREKMPLGMSEMRDYQVTVADGRATATLHSLLVEPRAGFSYVWRLWVADAEKNLLINQWYDQQIFRMDPSGGMEPTFQETFDLPEGAKKVMVALYRLPDGTDLATFSQSKDRAFQMAFKGIASVAP